MSDVIYLLLLIGFFALCAGLVQACRHIIGPDDLPVAAAADPETEGVAR